MVSDGCEKASDSRRGSRILRGFEGEMRVERAFGFGYYD
jgi:hypothetical protein